MQGNQTRLTTNLKGGLRHPDNGCGRLRQACDLGGVLGQTVCGRLYEKHPMGKPIDNGKNTTFVTTHKFTDNDDGTCTADNCAACGTITINHDGNGMYRDNADGTHTNYCMACDATLRIDAHNQSGEHVDNGDGTHRIYCSICGAVSVVSEGPQTRTAG